MLNIQEDCYYYVEYKEGVPVQDLRIRAMCMACAAKIEDKHAIMFWPGNTHGYNKDYEVQCTMPGCDRKIFSSSNQT